MRTIAIFLTLMFSIHTYAQEDNVSLGLIVGNVDAGGELKQTSVGFSVTWFHFYADMMGWPRWHRSTAELRTWNEKTSLAIHVGYELPLFRFFSVTPVVGYYKVTDGVTDGYMWRYDNDGEAVNAYHVSESKWGVDYGAVATVSISSLRLKVGVTRHTLWGGVGICF